MKYYIINNETDKPEGPYELEQLADVGVTPQTYVWCKGMKEWQTADEVPDICRYWRNRLYDIMHPTQVQPLPGVDAAAKTDMPKGNARPSIMRAGIELPRIDEIQEDINRKPVDTLWLAIVATLFCGVPFIGLVAVYYSYMTRKCWAAGEKERAHEMGRKGKMWTGIAFFSGLVVLAVMLFRGI